MSTISSHPPKPPGAVLPPAGSGGVPARPLPGVRPLGVLFRAMLFKEFRELARMLVPLMGVYAIVLMVVLRPVYGMFHSTVGISATVFSDDFILTSAIIPPVAGLLLGFVQFFRESRADRFGFIAHRPVTWGTLFALKSVAGLLMLFVAVGIPVMGAVLWLAQVRNVPLPFMWPMVLIPVADVLSGVPFYFAGVLIARRSDAIWLGSRLFPVAVAGIVAVAGFLVYSFGWEMLILGVGTVVLAVPGWAYFRAAGQYRPQARVAKFFLGVVVLTGIVVVLGVAIGLAEMIVETVTPMTAYPTGSVVVLLKDGTPAISQMVEPEKAVLKGLDGKVLAETVNGAWPGGESPFMNTWTDSSWQYEHVQHQGFHMPGHYFEQIYIPTLIFGEHWFRATKGNYLVGYDWNDNSVVGAIGPKGFERGKTVPSERFGERLQVLPADGTGRTLLADSRALYEVTGDRAVRELFRPPGDEQIYEPALVQETNEEAVNRLPTRPPLHYFFIKTNRAVTLFTNTTEPKVVARLEVAELNDYHVYGHYLAEQKQVLLDLQPVQNEHKREAVYLGVNGVVDHRVILPANIFGSQREMNIVDRYVIPSVLPPAFMVGYGCAVMVWNGNTWPGVSEYERHELMVGAISVLVAAGFVFWMGRRWGFHARTVRFWTILTLFLGPAGLVLMFCMRSFPVLAKCPACGLKHSVEDATCPHCNAPFVPPAANGTEIFA